MFFSFFFLLTSIFKALLSLVTIVALHKIKTKTPKKPQQRVFSCLFVLLDSGKCTAIVSAKLPTAQWIIETLSSQVTLNTTFSYELWSKQSQPLFITELVKSNFLFLGEKFTNQWQIGNFPWWILIAKWDNFFQKLILLFSLKGKTKTKVLISGWRKKPKISLERNPKRWCFW